MSPSNIAVQATDNTFNLSDEISEQQNENNLGTESSVSSGKKTPEEQSIEKILAYKRSLGENATENTRAYTDNLRDGGVYYIKNYFSGKYLNVHYGVDANGTNVYQWTRDNSTEQKFKIVYHSSTNSYKIYAMCSSNGNNRVIDVVRNGAALASGQNVDIWTPVDHTAQRLKFTYLIDGLYHIQMNANTDMYLTAYGNSNGTSGGKTATSAGNVFIKNYNVNDHQQWQLIEIDEPPVYADPYGELEVVDSTKIKGWTWCEDLPNTAMNIQIRIQNSAGTVVDTLTTTANIYRSDLSDEECGNGNYGFQCSVNWADYNDGIYTVRAFAGINTPDTELNNSPMLYYNNVHNAILLGVVDPDTENHDHLAGLTAAAPYIESTNYYSAIINHNSFTRDQIDDYMNNDRNNIFVYRGHGTQVFDLSTEDEYDIAYTGLLITNSEEDNADKKYFSNVMSSMDLSNMELMLFICCYSGAGGEYGNNFPANCVEMDAEVAVGFKNEIFCEQSNEWCEEFFELAKAGYTVQQIITILTDTYHPQFIYKNMDADNIIVCGNGNYILNGF